MRDCLIFIFVLKPDMIKLSVVHGLVLLFKFLSVVFNRHLIQIRHLGCGQDTDESNGLWIHQFSVRALHDLLIYIRDLLVGWKFGSGFNLVLDIDFVIRW